MKTIKFSMIAIGILLGACKPMRQLAQNRPEASEPAMANNLPLSSGTYFIVNTNEQALTPWNNGVGENVFLQPFKHSGMQQWQITKTPNTNNYTLKLAGTDACTFSQIM